MAGLGMLDDLGAAVNPAADYGWLASSWRPTANSASYLDEQGQAQDAREEAAATLAKRMRRQSPAVPAPEGGTSSSASSGDANVWAGRGEALPVTPRDYVNPSPQSGGPAPASAGAAPPAATGAPMPLAPLPPPVAVPPRPVAAPSASPMPQQDPAALPPNAIPTVGNASGILPGGIPPGAGAAGGGAAAPDGGSFFDKIKKGLSDNSNLMLSMAAGFAGAPSIGTGMSRAFTNAGPIMQQNQTYQALTARGMAPDIARAAVSNPSVLAQILPRVFGAKTLTPTQIGTDVLGHAIHGSFDPATGKFFDTSGNAIGGAGQPSGTLVGSSIKDPDKWAAMSPEDRLKTLPPDIQGEVKAVYEGRQSGSGRNVQQLLPYVNQVYPDFTMQDYKMKADTQHSFTGQGKNALELKAANTAITHADNLAKQGGLIDKLNNYGIFPSVANPVAQTVKGQLDPEFQATKGKYEAQVEGLAGELSKAFNGGQTAESDRQHWRDVLSKAKSPTELHAAVGQAMEMLHGRLNASAESYNKGMGSQRDGISFIDPGNQQIFKRLRGIDQPAAGAGGGTTAPSTSAPAAPTPGRYMYDPATRQMVPAQ